MKKNVFLSGRYAALNLVLFSAGLLLIPPVVGNQENPNRFPLRVSDSARYLVDSQGETFVWIGDTAWELFHRLDREDASYYLEDRKAKGFSVIQAVILAELDGLRVPNAYGDLPLANMNPDQPNEAYFKHVDFIVNKADSLGLVMGLLPTWGDKVDSANPGAGPVIFNPENSYRYGRFLGARYRNKPVIWILGGDRNVNSPEAFNVWNAMARGIKEGCQGTQLVTYHPRGAGHSAWWFHNSQWLDFNMYQSGHQSMNAVYEYGEFAYSLRPAKPFIDGEAAYEEIPAQFWRYMDFSRAGRERVPEGVLNERGTIKNLSHFKDGFITDYDVRVHAYWNFLSGAAGYTYGNNAIWQLYSPDEEVALPTLKTWREALDSPGASQMGVLARLLGERPLKKLRPDQAMIFGENRKGKNYILAASADDGSYAYVYLAGGQSANLVLSRLGSSTVRATWFNPVSGNRIAAGEVSTSEIVTLTPPQSEIGQPDWLLILEVDGQQ